MYSNYFENPDYSFVLEEYKMYHGNDAVAAITKNLQKAELYDIHDTEITQFLRNCLDKYIESTPKSKTGKVLRFIAKPVKFFIPSLYKIGKNFVMKNLKIK